MSIANYINDSSTFGPEQKKVLKLSGSKITENNVTIIGNCNIIEGCNIIIYGDHNIVHGKYIEIHGHHNTLYGPEGDVYGNHNKVCGCSNDVYGYMNVVEPYLDPKFFATKKTS